MKKLFIISLVLTTFSVFSQTTIHKVLADFKSVKVYNGIELELVKSNEQKIQITGAKADKVHISNESGMLQISMEASETTANTTVKATLYFSNDIDTIDAYKGAIVTSKQMCQPRLKVTSQQGSFINMTVKVTYLQVTSSSGGVIKLSGSAKNQTIYVDDGGVYHGYDLKATDVTYVRCGSGAKAEVYASKTLDVNATFGGNIFYKGNPEILKEKKVVGATIEQRN